MKKVLWKTLIISYAVGEVLQEKALQLEAGDRIVTAIATNKEPGQLVRLGLYENGNEVSAPMSLDFWRRSNSGHYLDGFKPIEFKGGSQITARITSPAPLAGEKIEIEVVFGIIKEDKEC